MAGEGDVIDHWFTRVEDNNASSTNGNAAEKAGICLLVIFDKCTG